MEDWRDPALAREWEASAETLATRAGQLDILVALVRDAARGGVVVDLGVGSGLVAERVLEEVPTARLVGIDFSPPMLALAERRLARFGKRVSLVEHDLAEIDALQLSDERYTAAISVQALHNVADDVKRRTIAWVSRTLAPAGLFVLVDRVAVASPVLYGDYRAIWERLARLHGREPETAATFEEHLAHLAETGDDPATLDTHVGWLHEANFDAACLHLHGNRAVVAARRRDTVA